MTAHEPSPFALTVDLATFTIRDGVFSVLLVQRGAERFVLRRPPPPRRGAARGRSRGGE